MDTNKIRDTPNKKLPVIKIWEGYDLEEVLDLDDSGYEHGRTKLCEVKLEYERK